MKNDSITEAKLRAGTSGRRTGTAKSSMSDKAGRTDWKVLRAMNKAEARAAARTDPDNPPREDRAPGRMKRVSQARILRMRFHLTQEEFSARFGIPLGTLRDWEQGKSEPDQAARAYLRVIAAEPEAVAKALRKRPAAL